MYKHDKMLRNLLTDDEIVGIAHKLRDAKPQKHNTVLWRKFLNYAEYKTRLDYERVKNVRPFMQCCTGQPFNSASDMRQRLDKTGVLPITTDYNYPDVNLFGKDAQEQNLSFRFIHDMHHCPTSDCEFILEGEICAFSKFAYYALKWGKAFNRVPLSKQFVRLLFCEIVAQICYLRVFGDYMPTQKTIDNVVSDKIINRILTAYEVQTI